MKNIKILLVVTVSLFCTMFSFHNIKKVNAATFDCGEESSRVCFVMKDGESTITGYGKMATIKFDESDDEK